MLNSILGDIKIIKDNKVVQYRYDKLNNTGNNFIVDGRYKIKLNNVSDKGTFTTVDCILESNNRLLDECYSESGENLEMLSFEKGDIKLSIGIEGDVSGIVYEYLLNGLRLKIDESKVIDQVVIYVAWIKMIDAETQDIYTWFAADPSI